MPGFMQSIKSHLPQSPFSPLKKGAPAVTTSEVMTPATDAVVTQEEPSSEVLPGESLVQPNTSTVALTLTPASGESSHQLTLDDAEVTSSAESPIQADTVAEAQPTLVETVVSAAPTEPQSEIVEAAQPIAEEVSIAAASQPQTHISQSVEVESTPVPETDAAISTEPTTAEVAHPQVEAVETKPDEQVVEEAVALSDEANVATSDVSSASPAADSTKPTAKAAKDGFSCHIKRSKSKKTKSDSPETLEVDESVPCKPRKSNPLAGKFRNVIEQVRSKVKKDKETLTSKAEPLITPTVEVIEPAAVCEEIAATA